MVVLVVEDEAMIRMLAVDTLTDAGFEVVEAVHGDQALSILQTHADQIHLIFSDIHMPGTLDGLALVQHAQSHWPWIWTILTSGQSQPASHQMPPGSRFIPKPYALEAVVNHVQELTNLGPHL
jgi:CheY-like chemotaxis protein